MPDVVYQTELMELPNCYKIIGNITGEICQEQQNKTTPNFEQK
jgi:hypothetical protein